MRIVLATPLYPPELGGLASYTKELATRLAKDHEVTIVAYTTRLPEKVAGVSILSVPKHRPLLQRLVTYTITLFNVAKHADVIYAQNGPSIELPVALVSLVSNCRIVIRIGDRSAKARAMKHPLLRHIVRFIKTRAAHTIEDMLPPRPEILPFQPLPTAQTEAFEQVWKTHIDHLNTLFTYA